MNINFEKNKDLTELTSFHVEAKSKLYAKYSSVEELRFLSLSEEFNNNEVLCLGEGSNILFHGDYNGLVIQSNIKGIKRYDKNHDNIFVIAGAGEKWTDLVDFCIKESLGGLENLAGIPGSVGAAPVQNIGAYGAEIADFIHKVECFDLITKTTLTLSSAECHFGYRDSIFKNEGKGRYVVTRVSLKLKNSPIADNLHYGPLKKLEENLGHRPTISEVAKEIIRIRNSKLPDPHVFGNAGSFFKNPIERIFFYQEVMSELYKGIPYYPTPDPYYVKIPAGWLIENAGLKGFCIGDAEVWPDQCLVIVNRGHATADEIMAVAKHVEKTVLKKFGVLLRPEVNIIDTKIKVTILGSAASKGMPEVGCNCPACSSEDKKDKRFRCSALIETMGVTLLIDVSPDFRLQALTNQINYLDAALITHSHYDHVGGFDDLRPFCRHSKFPVYLRKDVNNDIHKRLDYCFRDVLYPGVPSFEMHEITDIPFLIKGVKVTPINVMHGKLPIVGFRIGNFAYITDAKTIATEELAKLQDLDVLVVNALRDKDHFAHFTIQEALQFIETIKPRKAFLTHFCHEIGKHSDLAERLPENVYPCHDGMTILSD